MSVVRAARSRAGVAHGGAEEAQLLHSHTQTLTPYLHNRGVAGATGGQSSRYQEVYLPKDS